MYFLASIVQSSRILMPSARYASRFSVLTIALLAGCSVSPELMVDEYRGDPLRGERLAVVVIDKEVQVKRVEKLKEAIGFEAEDDIGDLFWSDLIEAMQEQLAFDTVEYDSVLDTASVTRTKITMRRRHFSFGRPQSFVNIRQLPPLNEPATLLNGDADYILFVEKAKIRKDHYTSGPTAGVTLGPGGVTPTLGAGGSQAYGVESSISLTLWDNTAGLPLVQQTIAGFGKAEGGGLFKKRQYDGTTWAESIANLAENVRDRARLDQRDE